MGKIKKIICEECGIEKETAAIKFCSIKCRETNKSRKHYQSYLEDSSSFKYTNLQPLKAEFLKEQNCKCAICGINNKWEDKDLIFILDHIDSKANNSNRDNLRLLCPNCDSQLNTYKSKNHSSERRGDIPYLGHSKKVNKEMLDEIIKMRTENYTLKEIAEKYNISYSAVWYRLKHL
jgi:endogenous inhibitor of DNA gyrase (YacG/DUF329 family)